MLNTCLKCVVFSVFQCYRYSISKFIGALFLVAQVCKNTYNNKQWGIQEKINHGYFVTKIQF